MFTPFAFIQPITTATPITPVTSAQYLLIGGSFNLYNAPTINNIAKIDTNGDLILDSSFNIGTGFNSSVFDIKQQPDGKYIVGGGFTNYNGSAIQQITRLNQNGTRDTTLNAGVGFNGTVNSISPQSNNSNVVVGGFTTYSGSTVNYITKLNASGAIDNSFNTGLGCNSTINDVVTQTDGKVIIGGAFSQYSSSNFYITRTDLSGSLTSGPGTGFNTGVGFNSFVFTYATQSDGKILVGGQFTTYSGSTSTRIVRINPDGTRDTSFVTGAGFNSSVYTIKVQTDGKIIVGGIFTTYSGSTTNYITRLNSSGSIDTTFNTGVGASSTVWKAHIQSDNKIVMVGGFATYSGSSTPGIVRINDSGSIDNTFSVGTGTVGATYTLTPTGSQYIIGGNFTVYNGVSSSYIARLNSDGTRDASFNIGTGFNGTIYGTAVDSSGRVIAAGNFFTYSGSANSYITRINTNGTKDNTFNIGVGFGGYSTLPSHLSVESDGKIYAGGNFTTYSGSTVNYFARINPDGTLDTTFPYNTSLSSAGFNNLPDAIFISSSNIYFGGLYTAYRPTAKILRLNTNGTIDTSFLIGTGLSSGVVNCLAIQSDGKILIAGTNFVNYSGSAVAYLLRLNTNGTLDTTFNQGTGLNGSATAITVQPDEKIVAIGTFTSYSGSSFNRIVRINPSGTRDTTFIPSTGIDNVSSTARSSKIIATPENKIYVTAVAMTTYSGSNIGNLVKINSSGSIDTTFSTTSSFSFGNTGKGFYAVSSPGGYTLILSGSSVIVGGNFTTYKNTAFPYGGMIDSTGAISQSFNIGVGFNSTVRTWATQSNGKILAGGLSTTYSGSAVNRIVRINTDGTLDNTFNIGTGFNNTVNDIRVQSDGKIIVVGSFTTYSGSTVNGIVRLNVSGNIDSTFNTGAGFTLASQGNNCKIQSDGKIIVVGAFTTYSGSAVNRIVRINDSGSIDNTFNVGAGFPAVAESVILQPDGKILVGGQFTSYSGSTQNRIVRINSNGTLDTSFNSGTGFGGATYALALQSDGKIIVTHLNQSYSGSTTRYITRINPSGTFDSTFNANANSSMGSTSGTQNSLAIDNDGSIYWGNSFTTFSGSFAPNRIVKLNTSGAVDQTFNQAYSNFINDTGKGANSTVTALLLL
jgi:uncharacterized delta-60 repeat protein